jgi:DNA-binding HxlR family transcriptional regulator
MKHNAQPRSSCPINYSLEIVGDAWSLLVIRDIVYFGKHTFGEFHDSAEGIARNILTNRLAKLEQNGILVKRPHPDGRKDMYALTEKGLDLIPVLIATAEWGAGYGIEIEAPAWWLEAVRAHREQIIEEIKQAVREGRAVFVGENTVASKYLPKPTGI